MESNLGNAILLLAVGMITVCVILLIVVCIGYLLIKITNHFYQEPVNQTREISPKSVAILSAVVDHITHGNGKLESIEKL